MQQIIYREFPPLPTKDANDMSGEAPIMPATDEVGGLCGMMQTWAQENGWRIASITPVTGTRRQILIAKADRPITSHTVGLIFVCDKL